jgi:CRISPR-associated protein Csb1
MPDLAAIYERLAAAADLEGDDAAVRVTATYEPIGGPYDKVSPPTYLVGDQETLPYLFEDRWNEHGECERAVLLDSRQAQANRCEEALLGEIRAARLAVPYLELRTTAHGRPIRISSLEAPHRSRDAYFRDATDERGTPFDETSAGAELKAVTPDDASALYRYTPTDLIYGVWDSHRKLRLAPKFPRVYTSEVVGYGALEGRRAAGRHDLIVSGERKVIEDPETASFQAGDGRAGSKLSELGHGSIPPSPVVKRGTSRVLAPGGVTVREVKRVASLGFAGLARVSLGEGMSAPAQRAARAVLGALALLADRLAFARPGVFLRSGCELVLVSEQLTWVGRKQRAREGTGALDLDLVTARQLAEYAIDQAAEAGATWAAEPILLRPKDDLQRVIEESFFKVPSDEE